MVDKRQTLRDLATRFKAETADDSEGDADTDLDELYRRRLQDTSTSTRVEQTTVNETDPPADPKPVQQRKRNRSATPPKADTTQRRTSLSLPVRTATALREQSQRTGDTLLEVIMRAFVSRKDDLTPADSSLAEFGISSTPNRPDGPITIVAINGPAAAFEALDDRAHQLGLSRSQLVTQLLDHT